MRFTLLVTSCLVNLIGALHVRISIAVLYSFLLHPKGNRKKGRRKKTCSFNHRKVFRLKPLLSELCSLFFRIAWRKGEINFDLTHTHI